MSDLERQAHENKTCLQLVEMHENGYYCDECGEELIIVMSRLTCQFCDYDLCQLCAAKGLSTQAKERCPVIPQLIVAR